MHRKRIKITTGRILKWTRVTVSVLSLTAMLLMFVATEGCIASWLGWLPDTQLFPLLLAGSGTAVALWLAVTMMFGRIYCSAVCPMGILQDIFSHLNRVTRKQRRKHYFRYRKPSNRTRYTILAIVAGSAVMGMSVITSLLDPYSAFGRIGSELLAPVVAWMRGNTMVMFSLFALIVAVVTLLAVGYVAWRHGRIICNTVCPIGATLSIFSRYSLLHFDIDTDLCVNCRKCERVCKAQCIDTEAHLVDGSRCVNCFNCLTACDTNALRYTTHRKHLTMALMQKVSKTPVAPTAVEPDAATKRSQPVKIDRRAFLATGLIVAATPAINAASHGSKRIKALVYGGKPLEPARHVAPPGRLSMKDFLEKCTGCGLCVSRCPAKVLHPSTNEFGWLHMLHPVLKFDTSYCRYNCTRCTEVCPTGALTPLTTEEKHIFIIGHARVEPDNCIGCGLCTERCPRKAVTLTARKQWHSGQSFMVATVDTSQCIGCGACEYICPATPLKAIVVDGIS